MKTRVLVGVPSGDNVAALFWASFSAAVRLEPEEGELLTYSVRGMNVVGARNKIVARSLKENFTHTFFMDSDMIFPDRTLSRLLHHHKDIIGGFYVRKKKDFLPTVMELGFRKGDSYMTTFPIGLTEVEAIGTGCLLIDNKVFKKVGEPWFEYRASDKGEGHMITEDLVFCEKAKKLGFKVWCDGDIICPHVGAFKVTPVKGEGKDHGIRIDSV